MYKPLKEASKDASFNLFEEFAKNISIWGCVLGVICDIIA